MADDNDDLLRAPPQIEQFVRLLVVVYKAVMMYPPASEIPANAAIACVEVLQDILQEVPDVRLTISRTGVSYNGATIFPGTPAFADFGHELHVRRLVEVRFHAGIQAKDIIAFLTVLTHTPADLDAAGGYEARLWELGVGTITVSEMRMTLVEKQSDTTPSQGPALGPMDADAIDDALAAAIAGGAYDEALINRLVRDATGVRDYLQHVFDEHADRAPLVAVGERFSAIAEVGFGLSPVDDQDVYRALAEAIAGLDPALQEDLLTQELLPESRTSPALAGVVRQMGFDNICRFFTQGLVDGRVDKEKLVRVIRGLVLLSSSERQETIQMAGSVMLDAGIPDDVIAGILELATPTRLTVRPSAPVKGARPADAVCTLLDLTRATSEALRADDNLSDLRAEAARGITDGDVVGAMVSLVGCDFRPAQLSSTMTMLEDALGSLIETGSIETAADAAVSLRESAKNPDLTPEQRRRIEDAVDIFGRPSDIRTLARTIRIYPKGSPESLAAHRLIDAMGVAAIRPLLENLADEPDMAVRKSLVDILSRVAHECIPELGAHVSDPRWYFTRNVVAILASTRSPETLTYLERTLRYPDARVRRETIRGLSRISDRLAVEMLVAALGDDDAQNVQLAARYLGQASMRGAIPALEEVARGEGSGSRETGPRVEAIEALGRLGAIEALPTLESLSGKRLLLDRGRGRELRAAASAAIETIKARETVQ